MAVIVDDIIAYKTRQMNEVSHVISLFTETCVLKKDFGSRRGGATVATQCASDDSHCQKRETDVPPSSIYGVLMQTRSQCVFDWGETS